MINFVLCFRVIAYPLCLSAMEAEPTTTDTIAAEKLFSDPKVLAMAKAAESGDIATIDQLLKDGVNVNTVGRGSATVLSRAFFAKNKRAYLFLLKHGANTNIVNSIGNGVINLAASEPDIYWLDQALQNAGNPNLVSKGNPLGKRTPLFYALYESRIENVKILIRYKANINFQDDTGDFPLYYAALKQDYDIVLVLLKAGADIRLKTKFEHDIFELTIDRDETEVKKSQLESFRAVRRFLIEKRGQ